MPSANPRAFEILMTLLKIPGPSCREKKVSGWTESFLRKLPFKGARIERDPAHKKIGEGDTGNLVLRLPGTLDAPRRLFSAHIDTVDIAEGADPVVRGDRVVPRGKTALGADNRSGMAAVLAAAERIAKERLPHPPLTLLFTVQEEVGLRGSGALDPKILGRPALGFNVDGGRLGVMTAAPSLLRFDCEITGIASHAGAKPEAGASAALVFADAFHALREQGLLGSVQSRGRQIATSNVGFLKGGEGLNVVMPHLSVKGEVRSFSAKTLRKVAGAFKTTLAKAASRVRNANGRPCSIRFRSVVGNPPFDLPLSSPPVRILSRLYRKSGIPFEIVGRYGILDANWLSAKGVPTVSFGAGCMNAHAVGEAMSIPDFYRACDLTFRLMTGD